LAFPDHVQGFITLNGSPRAIEGSESLARIHPPLDRSMVLLHDVVQVGASPTAAPATQFPLLLQFGDYLRVGGVAIDVDDARAWMTGGLQGPLEKALGRSRIPLHRQPEVDCGAGGIDGAVEILPVACHSQVGFVYSPGTVGRFQFPPTPLIEFWRVPLYPTPNGRMVSPQTSLREKFFDVAIGERIPQIPTDRAKNDGWFEVSPFEWCRSWFAH
jgi:hypothetical protein